MRYWNKAKMLDGDARHQYEQFVKWITAPAIGKEVTVSHEETNEIINGIFDGLRLHSRTPIFIREMGLVYLVASFEDFLSDLLRIVITAKPESLIKEDKKVSINDVIKYATKDQLLAAIIDEEISDLFYKDIEQIAYYLKRFKIDLTLEADWNDFKEVFYRRNVVIHNNGIVNAIYRRNTGYVGETIKLEIDDKYFERTLRLFGKYAERTTHYFVRKFGGIPDTNTETLGIIERIQAEQQSNDPAH